jgi:hypothetical protein
MRGPFRSRSSRRRAADGAAAGIELVENLSAKTQLPSVADNDWKGWTRNVDNVLVPNFMCRPTISII